jgi:hypothetical protein
MLKPVTDNLCLLNRKDSEYLIVTGVGLKSKIENPLIPKFAGSNPAEAVGFLKGDKNPQHAFLRKGSKIIGLMSQIFGMLKNPGYISQVLSGRYFRP